MTQMHKPDYFANFAAMFAVLMENKPKDAQELPPTEALLRGLSTVAHWYERQEASEETAAHAVELLRLMAYQYDRFWDAFFSIANRGDNFHEAARNAIDRGIEFRSMEEVTWWTQNHIPPDSE